jgi:hypothetical protein
LGHCDSFRYFLIFNNLGVLLSQFLTELSYEINHKLEDDKESGPNIFFDMINFIFVHHLTIIPLLVRVFSLGESIKYNYHHITRKFYDQNFQKEKDEHFRNKFYKRNFYYFKLFIIPLTILYFISSLVLICDITYCSLNVTLNKMYNFQLKDCRDKILDFESRSSYELFGESIFSIYLMLEILVYITLIVRVFRYPIVNDKFYLKLEFLSLIAVWIITRNCFRGFMLFTGIYLNEFSIFVWGSIKNLLVVIVYAVVTFIRRKINKEEIEKLIKDYNSFMSLTVSFSFFEEYIKNFHENDLGLILFWIEYSLFKKKCLIIKNELDEEVSLTEKNRNHSKYSVSNSRLSIKSIKSKSSSLDESLNLKPEYSENKQKELDDLKELANQIFSDYFMYSTSSRNSSSLHLQFPVDILVKVEDCQKRNFNININEFYMVFDEAFSWVNSELNKIFQEFISNSKEYMKLERIVFFIDFYEIKKVNFN